jgi:hypothetical protein
LEQELEVVRSERDLMEQRLDNHLDCAIKKDDDRNSLLAELAQAEELYKKTCEEHKFKIKELNKSHAEQYDQLCQEVILANREVVLLQARLSEVTRSEIGSTFRGDDNVSSIHDPPSHYYLSPSKSPTKITKRYKWYRLIRIVGLLLAIILLSLALRNKPLNFKTVEEQLSHAVHDDHVNDQILSELPAPKTFSWETKAHHQSHTNFISKIPKTHRSNTKTDSTAETGSGTSIKSSARNREEYVSSSTNSKGSIVQKFMAPLRRLGRCIKRIVRKIASSLGSILLKF